jgi:hypothetical protein
MSATLNLSEQELEQLKYPTGKLQWETEYTPEVIRKLIAKIEQFPADLRTLAGSLTKEDLSYGYRPGGWNIRQIIHHISDSHINAYIRTKLAITEENPTIKPYDENKWAAMVDANDDNIEVSILITENIHKKLVPILKSLDFEDFDRTYYHPDMKRDVPLGQLLSIYAWHGHHHLGQIKTALLKRF